MKKFNAVIFILFITLIFLTCCSKSDNFSRLEGPYLGQTPPGAEPEIFAPGLITTHYSQSYIAFLNDARVCVYSTSTEKGHETYYTYEKNGRWTKPQRAPFEELEGHPNYTTGPYGRKVYFHSGRPTHPDDTREDDNIWTIEWTGSGWAEPQVLPAPASSDYGEAYPSATTDGTVYFFTWRREGCRGDDIWLSRCIGGQYQEAKRLPWPINTDFIEYDPYVAPDESFLIFGSDRPGGFGNSDNYICFQKEDGSWTHPINLGRPLNSSSWDLCANGTPDGKYFFFKSGRKTDVDKGSIGKTSGEEPAEDSDLYWVNFSFIHELKNSVLNKKNAAEIIKHEYGKNGIQFAVDTLNTLHSDQKDSTYFSPFELLSLSKNMLAVDKTEDADRFSSALNEVLPKELLIKEGYARLCALNGRVSKGMKILEELDSEDPSFSLSDSLSALGYLFTLYPDKTEDALSVLQFTVEKFPEDPWAYFSLARVYRQLGDLDKAIENCRKSLEIRPEVGDISQLLERLLQEQEERKADNQKRESFPVLRGPYLGQIPPGLKPEIFASGVISTENLGEGSCAFTKNAELFLFNLRYPPEEHKTIYMTELKNGRWTEPAPAPFNSEYQDWDFHFAPDGKALYFTSKRPTDNSSEPSRHANIWVTHLTSSGWTPPQILEYPINTADSHNFGASSTKDGTLYFFSRREGGFGANDIYRARMVSGKYTEVENLGNVVNTEYWEYDAFIAPDESYLIFSSNRPGGYGEFNDIYISFRSDDDIWSVPKNLGRDFSDSGICCVTLDGRFLFFATGRTGNDDIYWVDARILEDLRPENVSDSLRLKGPYLGQKPPGNDPEIFEYRINPNIEIEGLPCFAKNGKLLVYRGSSASKEGVFIMEEKDVFWSSPQKILTLSPHEDRHFTLTPDGKRIFFTSRRPVNSGEAPTKNPNLWVSNKTPSGWTQPQPLKAPISTDQAEFYSTVTEDGILYFTRSKSDESADIYRSHLVSGEYTQSERLGETINTEYVDGDPYIAPDES
ncbi:MAG: tetratricopeptide repeat protein, partial [Candidatus Aminicenantes bacterium]